MPLGLPQANKTGSVFDNADKLLLVANEVLLTLAKDDEMDSRRSRRRIICGACKTPNDSHMVFCGAHRLDLELSLCHFLTRTKRGWRRRLKCKDERLRWAVAALRTPQKKSWNRGLARAAPSSASDQLRDAAI
jgi:hypothetical protein